MGGVKIERSKSLPASSPISCATFSAGAGASQHDVRRVDLPRAGRGVHGRARHGTLRLQAPAGQIGTLS